MGYTTNLLHYCKLKIEFGGLYSFKCKNHATNFEWLLFLNNRSIWETTSFELQLLF